MIRRSIVAVATVIALSAAAASTQAFADVESEAMAAGCAEVAMTQAVIGTAARLQP